MATPSWLFSLLLTPSLSFIFSWHIFSCPLAHTLYFLGFPLLVSLPHTQWAPFSQHAPLPWPLSVIVPVPKHDKMTLQFIPRTQSECWLELKCFIYPICKIISARNTECYAPNTPLSKYQSVCMLVIILISPILIQEPTDIIHKNMSAPLWRDSSLIRNKITHFISTLFPRNLPKISHFPNISILKEGRLIIKTIF